MADEILFLSIFTSEPIFRPFGRSANALGSSVQRDGPHAGRIGIARGDTRNGVSTVTFFTLDPPACK